MNKRKHLTTNQLPFYERPYEKCQNFGADRLTDAELLAVILRTGTKGERACELATRVLKASPDETLLGLNRLSFQELMKIHGIGRVKATEIQCILELAKRLSRSTKPDKMNFSSPEAVANHFMQQLRSEVVEKVYLLLLDTRCCLIKEVLLSSGGFNSSSASPREVFYEALRHGAVSAIMIHNHPSGDPVPSHSDIMVTNKIMETGRLIDIELLDHIVIGDNCYVSFREQGLM